MYRMKRIVATLLLLLVMGLGTPQVFAQGTVKPTETPGVAVTIQPPGDTPTNNVSDVIDEVVIYLLSTLIP